MRPLRVAHLTTVDSSLRYLLFAQLRAVRDLGGEVIGISAPGPDVDYLTSSGVRHIPLSASTRSRSIRADLRAARQLWSVLKAEDVDILHTHNPKPGVYGRVLGKLARVPVVVNTVHGLYASESDRVLKRVFVYAVEWLAALFSDAELVQSQEDVAVMRRLRIGRESRRVHLGNGISLERFGAAIDPEIRDTVRNELGISRESVVVGCVARLVEEKGIPELVEAYRRRTTDYRLVVVGPEDPSKADAVGDGLIRSANEDGVMFLGHRQDVERLYQAWDLFVLPSHREGFPRAAMEAAASGLPVIATDIRGCREVVDDMATGMLVPLRDPASLAAAIDKLVADMELRLIMGHAGREKARVDFDERSVVATVLETYKLVADRKGLVDIAMALTENGRHSSFGERHRDA